MHSDNKNIRALPSIYNFEDIFNQAGVGILILKESLHIDFINLVIFNKIKVKSYKLIKKT